MVFCSLFITCLHSGLRISFPYTESVLQVKYHLQTYKYRQYTCICIRSLAIALCAEFCSKDLPSLALTILVPQSSCVHLIQIHQLCIHQLRYIKCTYKYKTERVHGMNDNVIMLTSMPWSVLLSWSAFEPCPAEISQLTASFTARSPPL